jgi:hypothetical protein
MAKVKPAEGITATVIEGDEPEVSKTVSLKSPWGSKVTVAADLADVFKDAGYTGSKS